MIEKKRPMKYLKIESDKGFYRIDSTKDEWTELDQISKDDLLKLLEIASKDDFDMDEYNSELLKNPAHNIIYKNISTKFSEFLTNKTRFKDTAETMYVTAKLRYTKELEENEK